MPEISTQYTRVGRLKPEANMRKRVVIIKGQCIWLFGKKGQWQAADTEPTWVRIRSRWQEDGAADPKRYRTLYEAVAASIGDSL